MGIGNSIVRRWLYLTFVYSQRASIINIESINSKIEYFKLKVQIEETEYFFNDRKYELVIERLEPILLPLQPKSTTVSGNDDLSIISEERKGREIIQMMPSDRRLWFLRLLRESSLHLGYFNTWLSTVVECLIVAVGTMESGVVPLAENLEMYCGYLGELVEFVRDHRHWKTFIQDIDEYSFLIFLSLQICWCIVKQARDLPKVGKSAHSKRMKLYRSFCARSWVLFYYLLVDQYSDAEQCKDNLAEILVWAHEQLGLVRLCGGDDGALLKIIVKHLSDAGPYFYPEIYQCYSCLYGTIIKMGASQELIDHHCEKTEFGLEAGEILYKFISPLIQEKVDLGAYRSIPKDLLDCLSKVLDVCPSPPLDDSTFLSVLLIMF